MTSVVLGISQIKPRPVSAKMVKKPMSRQLKDFYHLTTQANVVFMFPKGLREAKVVNNEDFSFDYAMELPGRDFEVWFQVKSLKTDWVNYQLYNSDSNKQIENPDSLYNKIGQAQASAFTGDQNYFPRNIPADVLARYNADAGKTYFLNLRDLPETKHYKYALLITLEKDHTGTILAVCFCNDKGPEFFKNISKVSKCLKFKS